MREVRHLADVQDLVGRKGVQVDRRIFLLQPAEKIFVILDAALRVESALQQDLDAAGRHGLVDLGGQFLFAKRIAARPAGAAIEGAEAAVDVADVRVVDVPFDDVRYPPAGMQLVATHVGRQPQIGQRGIGRKLQGLIHREPAAIGGFAQEAVKGRRTG